MSVSATAAGWNHRHMAPAPPWSPEAPQPNAMVRSVGSRGSAEEGRASKGSGPDDDPKLREAFDSFVGQAFFGQMLKALRSTQGQSAYFHGGQAEEIFRGQLDQLLVERMSQAKGGELTSGMYELFTLRRS